MSPKREASPTVRWSFDGQKALRWCEHTGTWTCRIGCVPALPWPCR